MNKITNKEFIEKANLIHNNRYSYKETDYHGSKVKIKIICSEHGGFKQRPDTHLNGGGCIMCKNKIKKDTSEIFIRKAIKIHNDKYDYSKVKYNSSNIKVKIICKEHGIFEQQPNNHLDGKGCVKCGYANMKKEQSLGIDSFIEKAQEIHSDKYNYKLVCYINKETKVKIICPVHGVFEQTPGNHLSNHGCPICNESKGEKEVAKILDRKGIKYIREYRFDGCRNILPLPFDFYIPSINTCIEYDGKQHYEPVDIFGGEKAFNSLKKRDAIKDKYCKDNDIKLIRIKYNKPAETDFLELPGI